MDWKAFWGKTVELWTHPWFRLVVAFVAGIVFGKVVL